MSFPNHLKVILRGTLSPQASQTHGAPQRAIDCGRVRKRKFYALSAGVISVANECCVGDGAHAV